MRRVPTGPSVLGGVALAGAAGLLAVAVLRAVTVDPPGEAPASATAPGLEAGVLAEVPSAVGASVDGAEPSAVEAPAAEAAPHRGDTPAGALPSHPLRAVADSEPPAAWDDPLALAVDNDPFSPERRPPARRYRLPSERVPAPSREPEERPEAPDFRVVGSAAVGGGGLALVQVDRDDPRLVVLGESVGGYTLAAVDDESATLVGPAGSLRFPVVEPRSRDDDDDRRRRGREDADEERARRAREAEIRIERLREAVRRFQGNVRIRSGGGAYELAPMAPDVPRWLPGSGATLRPPGGVLIPWPGAGGGPPRLPTP